jgi:Family of unknown function (DUF5681)
MSRDHERTGYAQPPRQSQFKPGQSGNPAGRSRKVKAAPVALPKLEPTRTLIAKEAARLVTVRNGDERSEVTSTEAVLRAIGLVPVLRWSLERLTLAQGDRRDDQAYRRVQAGSGADCANQRAVAAACRVRFGRGPVDARQVGVSVPAY